MNDINRLHMVKHIINVVNKIRQYVNAPTNKEHMEHIICPEIQKWEQLVHIKPGKINIDKCGFYNIKY